MTLPNLLTISRLAAIPLLMALLLLRFPGHDQLADLAGQPRIGGATAPGRARRARGVAHLLLAGQSREVPQRVEVGHAGQQHPRAMAVDDRLGLLAVAAAGLGEVVEDRHQLDVVAGRGGRHPGR